MVLSENIKSLFPKLLIISAFCLPLIKSIVPGLLGLVLIASFFQDHFSQLKENFKKQKNILWFSVIYFLYVIGLTWTEDKSAGWFDLEVKLSMLIIPIVISYSSISHVNIIKVLKAFIEGCVIACIICILYACYRYYYTEDIDYFFYNFLSYFHHASYFSMYLNFAILLLLADLLGYQRILQISKWSKFGVIMFLGVFILFISSKTAYITLLLTIILGLFAWIRKTKNYKMLFIMLGLLLIIPPTLYHSSAIVKSRALEFIDSFNKSEEAESVTGTMYRMIIWEESTHIISNNVLKGVGTGDVKQELKNRYEALGLNEAYEAGLNCHNQYLQTFMAIGIIGITILLLTFFIPVYLSIKSRNFIYLSFLFLIMINFITESMLETQSGVVFYAFMNSLLFLQFKPYK